MEDTCWNFVGDSTCWGVSLEDMAVKETMSAKRIVTDWNWYQHIRGQYHCIREVSTIAYARLVPLHMRGQYASSVPLHTRVQNHWIHEFSTIGQVSTIGSIPGQYHWSGSSIRQVIGSRRIGGRLPCRREVSPRPKIPPNDVSVPDIA
eukprot:3246180-Rhodomonas_salina.1